jgi:two-component SAPR family response regulator
MANALKGIKVLVVEDDFLVSLLFEDLLTSVGCIVIGPVPRLPEALAAAAVAKCDAAVLDVNLAGDRVYPVAALLAKRNVPFMFVTGYGYDAIPREYCDQPRLVKPFTAAQLNSALAKLVGPPARA